MIVGFVKNSWWKRFLTCRSYEAYIVSNGVEYYANVFGKKTSLTPREYDFTIDVSIDDAEVRDRFEKAINSVSLQQLTCLLLGFPDESEPSIAAIRAIGKIPVLNHSLNIPIRPRV